MVQRAGIKDDQLELFGIDDTEIPAIWELIKKAEERSIVVEMVYEYGKLREEGWTSIEAATILIKDFNL